ncbi:hypothetical protein HMPREF1317_1097 [Schaalia georgiae F0490]|uniref:Uncharacterized protein n=1 Tax=Schaalia georgiae F0490 TaxID=1125717 RepID=J0WR45_9ACTO|nr:hypothetical protein HMPREF1317_1097 [Schaalia georgiae F0490]
MVGAVVLRPSAHRPGVVDGVLHLLRRLPGSRDLLVEHHHRPGHYDGRFPHDPVVALTLTGIRALRGPGDDRGRVRRTGMAGRARTT